MNDKLLIGIALIIFILINDSSSSDKCAYNISTHVSNAFFDHDRKMFKHENLTYNSDYYFTLDGLIQGCVCNSTYCLKKCCPIGERKFDTHCRPYKKPIQIDIEKKDALIKTINNYYAVDIIHTCLGFWYQPNEPFIKQEDGSILFEIKHLPVRNYCIDFTTFNWIDVPRLTIHICVTDEREEARLVGANAYGMFISIPFLLATFIVYALLPDRYLPEKCLMGFLLSLMCAFSFLIAIQFSNVGNVECDVLGGICLFSFMSTFCWMNVPCIDIYMTLSERRGFRDGSRKSQQKRFLLYCLYTICFPLMLVAIMLGINHSSSDVAEWYHPKFGQSQCWLGSNIAKVFYFYGPLGILLSINIVSFTLTAWKIRETRPARQFEGESQKHYNETVEQRFDLYLQLLIVMGMNWSLEFLSWLVDWLSGNTYPKIWYVTDWSNALYGVFIFWIFVWKRNIWVALQNRYYICRGQLQNGKVFLSRASHYNQMGKTENTVVDETTLTILN